MLVRVTQTLVCTLVIKVALHPLGCGGGWAVGMYLQTSIIASRPGPERCSRYHGVALQKDILSARHCGSTRILENYKYVLVLRQPPTEDIATESPPEVRQG